MIERLGKSNGLLALSHPAIEIAAFGKSPSPEDPGHHNRETGKTEPITTEITGKRQDGLFEALPRLSIVASGEVRGA